MSDKASMKPIIILPPGMMTPEDIQKLEANWLCVVIAKDPSQVKFLDPTLCIAHRTDLEQAAIQLSRKVLNPGYWTHDDTRQQLTRTFCDILLKGTPLDKNPTKAEQEAEIISNARLDELRTIAREEARAEKAAAKAKKEMNAK